MRISLPGNPYNIELSPYDSQIMISGSIKLSPLIMPVWRSTDELVSYAYESCVSHELKPEERSQYSLAER